jgi:hypothetical protein
MNKESWPTHISKLRTLYLSIGAWALLSLLSACQWTTKDSDYQPLPKKIIIQPKIEKKEIVKDRIDFSQCKDYDDIINLLEKKNYIKTIDPLQYFNNHHTFFKKANISQEIFIKDYNESDIVKYGVYTDDYIRSHVDKYLKVINDMLVANSNFTQYIEHPEQIVTSWLHGVVRKIDPDVDTPPKVQEPLPILDDIVIWPYNEKWKYPRWIASDSLQIHHIFLNSTKLWFKETGNNLAGDRTCIHGIKENTVWFLIALSQHLQDIYSLEICIKYKTITLRWWTEWYPHIDNPKHEHDHPWGEKVDFSIYAKRGVLLWLFFCQNGIYKLQESNELSPIKLKMVGYEIEVIPHAAHFDIWVIRKL